MSRTAGATQAGHPHTHPALWPLIQGSRQKMLSGKKGAGARNRQETQNGLHELGRQEPPKLGAWSSVPMSVAAWPGF